MVSGSLVSAKNKSSEPELEGNIRKLASANIAAWQAESEDSQMSTGNLGMMLGEVTKASTASTSTVLSPENMDWIGAQTHFKDLAIADILQA